MTHAYTTLWGFLRAACASAALAISSGVALSVAVAADAAPATATPPALTFEEHVWPLLKAHCLDCHGATEEREGGLDLRLVRLMVAGGESGPAVVPGDAAASLLLERVRSGEMPPGEKKMSAAEQDVIARWIAAGAPTKRPEPESIPAGLAITPEERAFWAFQPIRRPTVPAAATGPRTPIDALLFAADPLPPEADRHTLVTRAFLTLTGLPPSHAEVARWSADTSADWFDRLIDELLASPHYGEQWARHWLDVAGYADSEGATVADAERPWAWRYRDYCIDAFNADVPFDRFVAEQLAGDELAGGKAGDWTAEQIRLLTATGFLRMAADGTGSGGDTPEGRNQTIADTVRIVGTSLLGLSVHCAQCHDHRYDPILHTDYTALRAVIEPALDWQAWKPPAQRLVSIQSEAERARAAEIEAEAQVVAKDRGEKQAAFMRQALEQELAKFEEPLRGQLQAAYDAPEKDRTDEQKALLKAHPSVNVTPGVLYQYLPKAAEELKALDTTIAEIRAKKPAEEFLRALVEPAGHAPETRLFHRGDHQQPKQVVQPAPPQVAVPEGRHEPFPADDASLPTTGRRLALARWLASPANPLTARVIVNRIWLHHFGQGLVATPADFGALGARPSHPALLDWLAAEFLEQGWSVKKLHRTIMASAAWRQARGGEPHGGLPTSLVRLGAETIRDRMLAATGSLDATVGGRPVGIKDDDTGQTIVDGPQTRRSLYVQVRRSRPVAMLQAFDAPVMECNCEVRPVSTVATQSLMLLNGEFILDQAARLADRAIAASAALDPPPAAASLATGLPEPPHPAWSYGFGTIDEAGGRTAAFTALSHWTGAQWQAGAMLPDPALGWVFLNGSGGHPDVAERAVIRRWTAPADATVSIAGTLAHGSDNGDGVRGRIVSSRSGVAGVWTARHGEAATRVADVAVRAGDTLDFVTDCRENHTSDSFTWPVTLTLRTPDGTTSTVASTEHFQGPTAAEPFAREWIAAAWRLAYARDPSMEEAALAADFVRRQFTTFQARPAAVPAGRSAARQALVSLCQVLLGSNEFLYLE
jgi:hypothetical protein